MALALTTKICLRNDLAERWASVNPVLLAGEVGVEKDTGLFKIGNGTSTYSELAYANQGSGSGGSTPISTDGKTVINPGNVIALNNWGAQYYAYNSTTNTYSLQVVDETHPWKAGLTPRAAEQDGELVLAWFEAVDNTTLLSRLEEIEIEVGEPSSTDTSTLWGAINDKISSRGGTLLGSLIAADGTEVASKKYVGEQISQISALKRSIVESLPAIEDADTNTIYMVLKSSSLLNNNYEEYMVVDGAFELIGSTAVDLTDYLKRPTTYTAANLPKFDDNGSIADSGIGTETLLSHLQNTDIHLNSLQKQKLSNLLPIYELDSSLGFTDDGKLKVTSAPAQDLPLATQLTAGAVKASEEITVDDNGVMGIGKISISKLVNDDATELVLFGGSAGASE